MINTTGHARLVTYPACRPQSPQVRRPSSDFAGAVGLFFSVAIADVAFRFQLPPVKPCMRFARTRLTDIVHRQACTAR